MTTKRQLLLSLNQSLDASDIVSGICTELVSPSLQKYKRGGSLINNQSIEQARQYLRDWQTKETVDAIKLHAEEKRRNFLKLKRSLLEYSRRPNISTENTKVVREKRPKLQLNRYQTNKVDLERKYGALLSIKLQALAQAQQIDEYKRWMGRWAGRSNLRESPNVKKMNFLLEKISERKDFFPGFQPEEVRRTSQRNTVSNSKSSSLHKYTSLSTTKSKLW